MVTCGPWLVSVLFRRCKAPRSHGVRDELMAPRRTLHQMDVSLMLLKVKTISGMSSIVWGRPCLTMLPTMNNDPAVASTIRRLSHWPVHMLSDAATAIALDLRDPGLSRPPLSPTTFSSSCWTRSGFGASGMDPSSSRIRSLARS